MTSPDSRLDLSYATPELLTTLTLAERVEQAFIEARNPALPSTALEIDNTDPVYVTLRAMADDDLLSFAPECRRWPGSFHIMPGEDAPEIAEALRSVRIRKSAERIAKALLHERQHGEFAMMRGAAGVVVGIDLEAVSRHRPDPAVVVGGYFAVPLGVDFSKLVHGGGVLYPGGEGGPSYGDKRTAAAIGYPGGVQQVGDLIVAHNRTADIPIPLPLTYTR